MNGRCEINGVLSLLSGETAIKPPVWVDLRAWSGVWKGFQEGVMLITQSWVFCSMCKTGARFPAEISVKVAEVKHRGCFVASAGKAKGGLRRGGQVRSRRFSEKFAQESGRRYLC